MEVSVIACIKSQKQKSTDWSCHAGMLVNSMMNRWPRQRGPLNGTLYVGAVKYENNIIKVTANKKLPVSFSQFNILQTCSFTQQKIPNNSMDYLFIDPPFGSNINYSELNFIWETYHSVFTDNAKEAVVNETQKKEITDYRILMLACFKEAHRVLKPGRWMTVEFSNTSASVWNNIQSALTESGFIVANVSALDKKQGSFKAMTTPTAVKQDLIISAYKPNGGFEDLREHTFVLKRL